MVGKENEQEEDADDVVVAREREQGRGERRGAARSAARGGREDARGPVEGDVLVEEGYGKGGGGGEEPRESV